MNEFLKHPHAKALVRADDGAYGLSQQETNVAETNAKLLDSRLLLAQDVVDLLVRRCPDADARFAALAIAQLIINDSLSHRAFKGTTPQLPNGEV